MVVSRASCLSIALLTFGSYLVAAPQQETPPESAERADDNRGICDSEDQIENRVLLYLAQHGDRGVIDPVRRRQLVIEEYQRRQRDQGRIRPETIAGSVWTSIGPTNLAGRVSSIAPSPTAGTLYVGTADGGVWKTIDSGVSWIPLTDGISDLSVGAVAVAPSSANTVYVGTGEGFSNFFSIPGIGVLKSIDGGAMWTFPPSAAGATRYYKMLVNPSNANDVVMGTDVGLFRTTDGFGTTPVASTITPAASYGGVSDIVRDPNTATTLYAVTIGSIKSVITSTDGGSSWTALAAQPIAPTGSMAISRLAIAIDNANPAMLWIAAATYDTSTGNSTPHVFKMATNGVSWTELTAAAAFGLPVYYFQGGYDNSIVVSANSNNTVIVCGVTCISTINGGTNFNYLAGSYHVDIHDLRYQATTLYIGSDGGVFSSVNDGTAISSRTAGMVNSQFLGIALDPSNRNRIFGGVIDNGMFRRPDAGGTAWDFIFSGDGFECAVSDNSAVALQSVQNEFILRTRSPGAAPPFYTVVSPPLGTEVSAFYTVITPDPTNPNVIYTGATRVWKSVTGCDSWFPLSTTMTDATTWSANGVTSIAVAPANPQVLMAAKFDTPYYTSDGGAHWVTARSGIPVGRRINHLEFDSNNPAIAYACLSGTTGNSVYMTNNSGLLWTNRSGTGGNILPNFSAGTLRVDPTDSNQLFCGTDVGVYRSTDQGLNWSKFGTGLPASSVRDLRILPDASILRVATHGRGVWELSVLGVTNTLPVSTISLPASPMTVARGAVVTFQGNVSDADGPATGLWSFPDTWQRVSTGNGSSTVVHQFLASGVYPVTLTAIDSSKARVNSSVTITVSQPGDTCASPYIVPVGSFPRSVTADSEAVTTNNVADPIPTGCLTYRPFRRVWFSFTPAVSGSYEFSTCGATFDTVIGVYSGSCGALTQLNCNDDDATFTCSEGESRATATLTSGTTYRIMVGGKYSNEQGGAFALTVNTAGGGGPGVAEISPIAGPSAGGAAVTINGTGFVAGATVSIGGSAATNLNVLSANVITATTSSHPAGTIDVVVTNPDAHAGALLNGYTYVAKARSDFDGDGRSDVIWRKSTTGEDAMWLMNGVTLTSPVLLPTVADTNWKMAGVGDFDGDGKADVIWSHNVTGQVVMWLMNGTALSSAAVVGTVADTNWKIAGVGDFNNDGKSDVVWRQQLTGQVVVWLMNGTTIVTPAVVATVPDLNYTIAGIGDFDGDGKADLFWHHGVSGANVIWFMNGAVLGSAAVTNTVSDTNYKVVGVGDADANGKADVFWWNQATGDVVLWAMNGTTVTGGFITTVSEINWHVEGVGDFDGDGKADLIWRKVTNGDTVVWLMNGLTLKQATYVTTVSDLNWSIVAPR